MSDKNVYDKNSMFAKWMKQINYNVNDPEKQRIEALTTFIKNATKKERKRRYEVHGTTPTMETMNNWYALNAYIMLTIVHRMPRRFNINKDQCTTLKTDIEYLIKKYKLSKRQTRKFDKTLCDKKFKRKKNQ